MSSVITSTVSGSASQQSSRLALLVKLFQTSGKSAQDSKKSPAQGAAPPPPPPPPAQTNSAGGLASMFQSLQAPGQGSVSEFLSRLLQAVDKDGDGTISADELQAVTDQGEGALPGGSGAALPVEAEPAVVAQKADIPQTMPPVGGAAPLGDDSDVQLLQSKLEEFEANKRKLADPAVAAPASTGQTSTAYEALFQALQLVFAQANPAPGTTSSRRYTDLLQSLAKAG